MKSRLSWGHSLTSAHLYRLLSYLLHDFGTVVAEAHITSCLQCVVDFGEMKTRTDPI